MREPACLSLNPRRSEYLEAFRAGSQTERAYFNGKRRGSMLGESWCLHEVHRFVDYFFRGNDVLVTSCASCSVTVRLLTKFQLPRPADYREYYRQSLCHNVPLSATQYILEARTSIEYPLRKTSRLYRLTRHRGRPSIMPLLICEVFLCHPRGRLGVVGHRKRALNFLWIQMPNGTTKPWRQTSRTSWSL